MTNLISSDYSLQWKIEFNLIQCTNCESGVVKSAQYAGLLKLSSLPRKRSPSLHWSDLTIVIAFLLIATPMKYLSVPKRVAPTAM